MKDLIRSASVAIVLSMLMAVNAWSAELGDPAGSLNIQNWVKGDAVSLADGKGRNVYVVEFWATWCGPCRTSIPHLTRLQAKYEKDGVIFIGVSDESAETVAPYVAEMGSQMNYRVAVDPTRQTHARFMRAYGRNTIPSAFVVDLEGRVVWAGHPMDGLDTALSQVVGGTYDIEATKQQLGMKEDLPTYFKLAFAGKTEAAKDVGDRIYQEGRKNAQLMNQFAWAIATEPGLAERDLALAKKAATAAYIACDGEDPMIVDTYARVLFEMGDVDGAIEYQQEAIDLTSDLRLRRELKTTLEMYLRGK